MRDELGLETFQFGDSTTKLLKVFNPLTKEEHELAQVVHYCGLAFAKYPELAFQLEGIGGNPPDFLISRGNKEIKLDVVSFSFTQKRAASVRFRTLKQAVLESFRRGELPGLSNINFAVRFLDNVVLGDIALNKIVIPEFIESLKKIGRQSWSIDAFDSNWAGQPGPGPFPMNQEGTTSDNKMKWYVSRVGQTLIDNDFVRECNFNIENNYRTTLNFNDIEQRVMELIQSHDQPLIEELLIVAGGPDKFGEGFDDEASFASIFISRRKEYFIKPKYLQRIVIDNWRKDTLDVIYENKFRI